MGCLSKRGTCLSVLLILIKCLTLKTVPITPLVKASTVGHFIYETINSSRRSTPLHDRPTGQENCSFVPSVKQQVKHYENLKTQQTIWWVMSPRKEQKQKWKKKKVSNCIEWIRGYSAWTENLLYLKGRAPDRLVLSLDLATCRPTSCPHG